MMSRVSLLTVCMCILSGCENNESHLGGDDFNGDGKPDVFYEFDGDYYYEQYDKNFDGKIDETQRFSLNHMYVGAKYDDDFDGYPETELFAENGLTSKVVVDVSQNEFRELCLEYENGILKRAYRYYPSTNDIRLAAQIGRVEFAFDYPVANEVRTETSLTGMEFSKIVEKPSTSCALTEVIIGQSEILGSE